MKIVLLIVFFSLPPDGGESTITTGVVKDEPSMEVCRQEKLQYTKETYNLFHKPGSKAYYTLACLRIQPRLMLEELTPEEVQ